MNLKNKLLTDPKTGNLLDYDSWNKDHKLYQLFNLELNKAKDTSQKINKELYISVDPNNKVPIPAEMDDLTRLHFITRSRKVTTVMEFGAGKSTRVFADALKRNKKDYENFVKDNFRRANPFEVHSVDNSKEWIEVCRNNFPGELLKYVTFHYSEVEMTTFNGRACTRI